MKPKTPRHWRGVFVFCAVLCGCSLHAQNIGDVYASDAAVKGTVRETASGLEVSNGSVITAGQHSATLRLSRGGQVRICPGTNLSVNSSPKGQELMFAISAGSLEGDYPLPATADAILTPDFRILISGPAAVSISITASQNGDACVHTRGDESYVVVSELMGDEFYRVKPNEQVFFHAGHTKDPEVNGNTGCGCPAPAPVEQAEAAAPAPLPAPATPPISNAPAAGASEPSSIAAQPAAMPTPTPEQRAATATAIQNEPAVAAAANAAAALPQQSGGPVQVEVDAPMIFKGSGAPPDVTATLARVHIEHLPWPDTPSVSPQPPADSKKTNSQISPTHKKGFFHRLARILFG